MSQAAMSQQTFSSSPLPLPRPPLVFSVLSLFLVFIVLSVNTPCCCDLGVRVLIYALLLATVQILHICHDKYCSDCSSCLQSYSLIILIRVISLFMFIHIKHMFFCSICRCLGLPMSQVQAAFAAGMQAPPSSNQSQNVCSNSDTSSLHWDFKPTNAWEQQKHVSTLWRCQEWCAHPLGAIQCLVLVHVGSQD